LLPKRAGRGGLALDRQGKSAGKTAPGFRVVGGGKVGEKPPGPGFGGALEGGGSFFGTGKFKTSGAGIRVRGGRGGPGKDCGGGQGKGGGNIETQTAGGTGGDEGLGARATGAGGMFPAGRCFATHRGGTRRGWGFP